MCGIVGVWAPGFGNEVDIQGAIRSIAHRGPDDSGEWRERSIGLVLGHARLSILDLSPAGHQPMRSHCGRFVIVYNGEVYNHLELRKKLEAAGAFQENVQGAWHGHSDTETLLACFSVWGVEKTLKAAVGMFSFALWDRRERRLYLARDRFGEKPLYYGINNGKFVFSSELKALRMFPGFCRDVDRDSIALLMRHNYIPAPYSIYEGIFKLFPGTLLSLTEENVQNNRLPEVLPYWSSFDVAVTCAQSPADFDHPEEAIDGLEGVLSQSVKQQMISDVPLGAFLSGGVDSSAIVALMQAKSSRPIKTFSIGFHEKGYNEAEYAKAVARHIGTDHTELYVTSKDALDVIPNLPEIFDEPFSDSSQIPTWLVSQLARRHVTVSLSGDAGDELFGGYNRYFLTHSLWSKIQPVPIWARRLSARAILSIRPSIWNQLGACGGMLLPNKYRRRNLGNLLHKLAGAISAGSGGDLYRYFVSHSLCPEDLVLGAKEPATELTKARVQLPTLTEQMMALDTVTYLSDDILVKVDRAAMAVSLETRVPFLDHRVFEFAWRLPLRYKVADGQGKWILRQLLYRYVPKELIERPKMGFGVPIDSWLRGPLRDWAESLLAESRLKDEGFFQSEPIRRMWSEHIAGIRNWQYHLWDVLMFQAWHDRWHD